MADLPQWLSSIFWDQDFSKLTWQQDRDMITARVLTEGGWKDAQWLRSQLGDKAIRNWIAKRKGRGLSPQRLRFWELILDLPHSDVNSWLASRRPDAWERRIERCRCGGFVRFDQDTPHTSICRISDYLAPNISD